MPPVLIMLIVVFAGVLGYVMMKGAERNEKDRRERKKKEEQQRLSAGIVPLASTAESTNTGDPCDLGGIEMPSDHSHTDGHGSLH